MFKFSVTVKLAKLPVDTSRKLKVPVDELRDRVDERRCVGGHL
jgi:hypothetical protein